MLKSRPRRSFACHPFQVSPSRVPEFWSRLGPATAVLQGKWDRLSPSSARNPTQSNDEILPRRAELYVFGHQGDVAKLIPPKSGWKQGHEVRRWCRVEPQLILPGTTIAVRGIK